MIAAPATDRRFGTMLRMPPLIAAIAGAVAIGRTLPRFVDMLPPVLACVPALVLLTVLAVAARRCMPQPLSQDVARRLQDAGWDRTLALMEAACVHRNCDPEPFHYPAPGFEDARPAWGS